MESIGKYLQERREALGLSIEDVSQSTKMKTYIIEQLEKDDFAAIDDIGFLKIMIITYSRFLEVDTEQVQAKLVQLFEKKTETPIKIESAKNKKTVFIQPNTIYFVLLGLMIIGLSYTLFKLYRDGSISLNAIRNQLTTTEQRTRTSSEQTALEPDSLWIFQRQLFHEINNIQIDSEVPEPIFDRLRFFSRSFKKDESAKIEVFERHYLNDNTDYVGEMIFENKVSPLNPKYVF